MENNLQLSELRQLAKEKGLKNISKLKKNELIELLNGLDEDNLIEDEEKDEFVSRKRSV